ncbi:unnamed protein product [Toxocara canis]|uniref:Uncharacterized protein n=1 Tax=Toxocara canis TaxID=6265 RepID=A0A183UTT6_TOXCA|nr:unnamed protein product [Toxocara canis]
MVEWEWRVRQREPGVHGGKQKSWFSSEFVLGDMVMKLDLRGSVLGNTVHESSLSFIAFAKNGCAKLDVAECCCTPNNTK